MNDSVLSGVSGATSRALENGISGCKLCMHDIGGDVEPDLDDLPAGVREEVHILLVSDVNEALRIALEPAPVRKVSVAL